MVSPDRRPDALPFADQRETPRPIGFVNMLEARQRAVDSLLCVGLDPVLQNIPFDYKVAVTESSPSLTDNETDMELDALVIGHFSQDIVDATHPHVSAYKPNIAFYERYGEAGIAALRGVIVHIREVDPTIPIILDAKRADIGATNQGYADMVKGLGVDAVTVNPYFGIKGKGALDPFLDLGDTGVIILCRTSNPEAAQMQDVTVKDPELGEVPYYMMVARLAEQARQTNPNVAIVVGATVPEQLKQVREIFKGQILVPGLGKQGGRPEDLVGAFDENGLGIIANNASAIIHASTENDCFVAADLAARDWRDRINEARKLPRPAEQSQEEKLAAREEGVMQVLTEVGALLEGHFLLKSGRHSDKYANKDRLYPHTSETAELSRMMAVDFKDLGVDVVVGPEKGGIILANNVAAELTRLNGRDVPGVYAEKSPVTEESPRGGFDFQRGYADFVRGKRVLITEDILTTGGSVQEVIKAVNAVGGEVVGVAGILNRGGVTAESLGVPVLSVLANLDIPSWEPNDCGLCESGIPIDNQVGHGKNTPSTV